MLTDKNGREYWKVEIYFSESNIPKIQAAWDILVKAPNSELRGFLRLDGFLKAVSYNKDEIVDLTLAIAEIELKK